ncbi:F0F1 ATP synthase subunit gamma [Novipirellula sp.]|uniref:F0F1 ATP synthase subunit gamma n=1 Tax=Novipirellula sp. TaxID=2795430 RepID=UPI00356A943C
MPTLEYLRHRIETASDLRSAVATMKTLAAVNIHQYERAADALGQYSRTIELGLQIMLRGSIDVPVSEVPTTNQRNGNIGVIVFGSDQGMCGQFNEQIAAYAAEQHSTYRRGVPAAVWIVGGRVYFPLTDSGWSINQTFRVPTSVPEVADRVCELLTTIEHLRERRNLCTLRIYFNMRSTASSYQPNEKQLLPISPTWLRDLRERKWESRSLPRFGGDRDEMTSLLIRQCLYVSLYQACAESLASENASRIAAMQAAEKNIDDTLDELQTAFKTQRQTAITEELLDVVTGFEALMSGK